MTRRCSSLTKLLYPPTRQSAFCSPRTDTSTLIISAHNAHLSCLWSFLWQGSFWSSVHSWALSASHSGSFLALVSRYRSSHLRMRLDCLVAHAGSLHFQCATSSCCYRSCAIVQTLSLQPFSSLILPLLLLGFLIVSWMRLALFLVYSSICLRSR